MNPDAFARLFFLSLLASIWPLTLFAFTLGELCEILCNCAPSGLPGSTEYNLPFFIKVGE